MYVVEYDNPPIEREGRGELISTAILYSTKGGGLSISAPEKVSALPPHSLLHQKSCARTWALKLNNPIKIQNYQKYDSQW